MLIEEEEVQQIAAVITSVLHADTLLFIELDPAGQLTAITALIASRHLPLF